MCLAIPGKILNIEGNSAIVDFDGIKQSWKIRYRPCGVCN